MSDPTPSALRIADTLICWSPNRPEIPAGYRAKARIWPGGVAGADPGAFTFRGGCTDPRAHDTRRSVREAYVLGLFNVMVCRDGLDPGLVNGCLWSISEYRSGSVEEAEAFPITYPDVK